MEDSTFYTAISDPDLASRIMTDPIAAHLNLVIHGLPSSLLKYCVKPHRATEHRSDPLRPSFSLALHMTLAKTILYQGDKDIISIIRACMQVIVTYSLVHDQYSWVGGEAHRTIEDLAAKISLLVHFGTAVPASESSKNSMQRNAVDAVMIFRNKGMVYRHFATIISKFIELDKTLELDTLNYVMFQPKEFWQLKKMEVLSRLLTRGRDDMAG
ncbi:MAG: hypothetical protein L6R38_009701, partial [Xanthoria sp. 2 TBL-2021]